MKEVWVDIVDYEGHYQVSNLGRVRSLDRYVKVSNHQVFKKGKILSQCNTNGYLSLCLRKDGKAKTIKVHIIVANHFIPSVEGKIFVNHKNGIKSDNNVNNLEWVTPKENSQHASETGLLKKGSDHHSSILTEDDVMYIRSTYKKGEVTQQQLADEFGVCRAHIGAIILRKRWDHL